MANVTNKIFVDRMGGRKAAEYVGIKGDLFYDSDVGSLRISDGVTPGGKPAAGNGAGVGDVYRYFQAGANMFRNNNGETDITQIIIHNAPGRVDYINYTPDTDNDDFYATGLIRNSETESANWNADKIVVLNIYSQVNSGISSSDLATFVRKFIDTVLYDSNDNAINDLSVAKQAFYDNYEVLAQSLPAGALFENFEFDDNNRFYTPEFNMINADGTTGDNYSAYLTLRLNHPGSGDPSYDNSASIYFHSSGTGYAIGDKITVNGQDLGGVNVTNDFTLTVNSVKSGNITGLTMTSGGTNFYPHNQQSNSSGLNGGDGSNAAIRIISCDSNGVIQEWQVMNDGYNYLVGDTLTLNYGGDDATFEVTSVGTNGIDGWDTWEGTGYYGTPGRVDYGYWPNMCIGDGGDDQYDTGNFISTDRSSQGIVADFNNGKMTVTNWLNENQLLQPGQVIYMRNPENTTQFSWLRVINQSTDNTNVYFVDWDINSSNVQCRVDGIPYANGLVQTNSNAWGGGSASYVTVYDNSIFAMIAFDAYVNSVYYNGETGVDSNGVKNTEVLLGVTGGNDSSRSITQTLTYDGTYFLQPSDAGKHIYNPDGNNTIVIPVESVVNFPVGTAITFVSTNGNPTRINRANGDVTQVWGAGFDQQSNWWAIPSNSMGTLLKIAPEKWIVSGAGLYNDD